MFTLSTTDKQEIAAEEARPTDDEAKPAKTAKSPKKPKQARGGYAFSIFNLLLSIVIICSIGFLGYKGWLLIEEQKNLTQNQQQQLVKVLATQDQVSSEVQKQLQQNTLAQNTELTTLKETISAFLKQSQHTRRDWLIAEAEYLIKLANHRLVLARDVATGIQALQAADDRLLEVGDPKFIPLRKALAIDIQKLNTVPILDLVGISLKLNALQQQVETLPLITPDPKTIQQRNNTQSNVAKANSWQQLPNAIWQDLLKLVHIQHHDETIKPLLLPEQRFFLLQNLKLQLEQARLALLNDHPIIYKDRIQQAQHWIGLYFDKQKATTQTVDAALTKLAETNITQDLPDISDSLSNLQLLHTDNTILIKPVPVEKKSVAKLKKTPKKEKSAKTFSENKKIIETTTEISKPAVEKARQQIDTAIDAPLETPVTKN